MEEKKPELNVGCACREFCLYHTGSGGSQYHLFWATCYLNCEHCTGEHGCFDEIYGSGHPPSLPEDCLGDKNCKPIAFVDHHDRVPKKIKAVSEKHQFKDTLPEHAEFANYVINLHEAITNIKREFIKLKFADDSHIPIIIYEIEMDLMIPYKSKVKKKIPFLILKDKLTRTVRVGFQAEKYSDEQAIEVNYNTKNVEYTDQHTLKLVSDKFGKKIHYFVKTEKVLNKPPEA